MTRQHNPTSRVSWLRTGNDASKDGPPRPDKSLTTLATEAVEKRVIGGGRRAVFPGDDGRGAR